jgi:hypothetical protein
MVRKRLVLPYGYSAKSIDAGWCLVDPDGVSLMCSTDATAVEIHAWRDTWRRRHKDFTNELAVFRSGARLPDIGGRYEPPSLSQAAERQPEPKGRAGRIKLARWQVLATTAAGAAAGLVIGLAGLALMEESPEPLPLSNQRAASVSATVPKPLRSVLEHAGGPASVRTLGARVPATKARTALRSRRVARPRPKVHYAVSVGIYVNPATADRMKHLVRSKGYIVDVVPHGVVSQVMTRPYRTRAQAERVARGLEEIRLPAQLITRRAM